MGVFSNSIRLVLFGIVLTAIVSDNQVAGQCCRSTRVNRFGGGICADGTRSTPCCGHRSCNIFCCNCSDGGCRGRRWARDVAGGHVEEHEHDKNKDGFYDKHEVHNLILSGTCGNYTEKVGKWEIEFRRMDKDKDGKLSYEEING
ncbi:unnamed protein product [Orchesella dallaii]|uniref:EF-hand domain-containing protein n=1 Tax=Orchesella dallaii TaxID=48710 RepID=A0ABP1RPU0_9HEXA